MTACFADTHYFLALLNPADKAHGAAIRFTSENRRSVVTTAWVLTELADALADPAKRASYLQIVDHLCMNPQVEIVPPTLILFQQGNTLYRQRMDKEWTLTDCISFIVMNERRIRDALTGDRHFEQAGFRALLR
jgi:uncharacterized protein